MLRLRPKMYSPPGTLGLSSAVEAEFLVELGHCVQSLPALLATPLLVRPAAPSEAGGRVLDRQIRPHPPAPLPLHDSFQRHREGLSGPVTKVGCRILYA